MDNNPVTIAADTLSVTPEAGVTVAANGTNVQVQVTAGASPGPRVITAADAADANRQARRTIVVV